MPVIWIATVGRGKLCEQMGPGALFIIAFSNFFNPNISQYGFAKEVFQQSDWDLPPKFKLGFRLRQ
jgi:hypothetical protein